MVVAVEDTLMLLAQQVVRVAVEVVHQIALVVLELLIKVLLVVLETVERLLEAEVVVQALLEATGQLMVALVVQEEQLQ